MGTKGFLLVDVGLTGGEGDAGTVSYRRDWRGGATGLEWSRCGRRKKEEEKVRWGAKWKMVGT